MKEELHVKDYDLICSTLVSGSYSLDIYSSIHEIKSKEATITDFQGNPSSMIFLNQQEYLVFADDYDYIIDFSNNIGWLPSNYHKTEFVLTFNTDGSICCMYETDKKLKHLKQGAKEKKISVYYKSHLFFHKQIKHLPCDNYLISFGDSENSRHIQITLYLKNQHIIDLKIAYDHDTLFEIYKQKYFMSKLSFYDFETISFPHEYFSKNQKIVINSVLHTESIKKQTRDLFAAFLEETYSKSRIFETIRNSKFYVELTSNMGKIQNVTLRENLKQVLQRIPVDEKMNFCLSFGKIEHVLNAKLVCSDLTDAQFNAPFLADFFYQFIEEMKGETFNTKADLRAFLNAKVTDYGLSDFLSDKEVNVETYFYLFLVYFVSNKPFFANVQLLNQFVLMQENFQKAS